MPSNNTTGAPAAYQQVNNRVNRWTVMQSASLYSYTDRATSSVAIRELARRIFGLEQPVDTMNPFTTG